MYAYWLRALSLNPLLWDYVRRYYPTVMRFAERTEKRNAETLASVLPASSRTDRDS